jgi:hypothetical protein
MISHPALLHITCLAAVLVLSGCAKNVAGVTTMPAPKTPDQALFEAETDFDLVLKQAEVYAALPRCSASVTTACATAPVIIQIYQAATKGAQALAAAKTAVQAYDALSAPGATDLSKATASVAALVALVPQITALLPATASS